MTGTEVPKEVMSASTRGLKSCSKHCGSAPSNGPEQQLHLPPSYDSLPTTTTTKTPTLLTKQLMFSNLRMERERERARECMFMQCVNQEREREKHFRAHIYWAGGKVSFRIYLQKEINIF